ncbi:GGDEF domain-containing protein [Parasphingorhabdus sp.]|jgi:diguanylate cyclase (GGDEF)-like protein|uniref:GGDEF domain-containing protein n=1 Tax=Parasphingorhabdus sp. TaxID=2709688 RepID=UPI0039E71AF6
MVQPNPLGGKLNTKLSRARWLFAPGRATSSEIQSYLLAQLLNSAVATLMGSFCSLVVLLAAFLRSGLPIIAVFLFIEIILSTGRLVEWQTRERRRRASSDGTIDVSWSVMLTVAWCTLQGAIAFTIMSGSDPVLQVLSATLIMAMIGPICARNYPTPRFATLLLLLCDLPFVAGAVSAKEPMLSVIVLLTPPFLLGAYQIIRTFHDAMLDTLFAQEQSRHLAMHDSLTGIFNRQGMDDQLSRFRPQSGRTMAIVSLDLDGFKAVNDTYGHGAGDLVLMQVASLISSRVGQADIVARMGGDEFMIVLPDCDADAAKALGLGLVQAISQERFIVESGTTVRVGASAGYACFPEDASTTLELRLRADRALYDAKHSGKSTCCRFNVDDLSVDEMQKNLRRAFP